MSHEESVNTSEDYSNPDCHWSLQYLISRVACAENDTQEYTGAENGQDIVESGHRKDNRVNHIRSELLLLQTQHHCDDDIWGNRRDYEAQQDTPNPGHSHEKVRQSCHDSHLRDHWNKGEFEDRKDVLLRCT